MIKSMTGFASAKGALAPHNWGWELRSVNAKGLDLRLRLPEQLPDGVGAAWEGAKQRSAAAVEERVAARDQRYLLDYERDLTERVGRVAALPPLPCDL